MSRVMNEILKFLSPYNNKKFKNINTVNWDKEIKRLVNHRLASLFFWKLEKAGQLEKLPPKTCNILKNMYLCTLINNTNIANDIEALAPHFNDFNYAIVKGVHLSHGIYPDIGTRPFVDIDVMIDESDMKDCKTLLKDKEYENVLHSKKYPTFNEEVFAKIVDNKTQYFLDIHSHTLHNKRFDKLDACRVRPFLMETEYLKINNTAIRVLSPEALIIYLNIHTVFAHFYQQIIMLLDILWSYKANENRIDMEKLSFMAKKLGILRSMRVTFGLIDDLFGTKIGWLAAGGNKTASSKPFLLNFLPANKLYSKNASIYWRRFVLQPFLFDSLFDSKYIILRSCDTLFSRFQINKAFNFIFKNF